MLQTIKQNIMIIAAAAVLAFVSMLAVPGSVSADESISIEGSTNCGVNDAGLSDTECETNDSANEDISGVIRTVINVFSAIVGSVSVIMIIVGGFRYITSNGDSNNVSAAKNTILYAIVGLVIVAFAQIIVQFVLERTAS